MAGNDNIKYKVFEMYKLNADTNIHNLYRSLEVYLAGLEHMERRTNAEEMSFMVVISKFSLMFRLQHDKNSGNLYHRIQVCYWSELCYASFRPGHF